MRRMVIAALVLLTLAAMASAQNLVVNGNFESGTSGWTKWQSSWGSGEVADFANTEPGHLGNACLNLRINGQRSFGVYQQIATTPGKTYKIDVYWKGKRFGADNWAEVMLLDGPFDMNQADTGGAIVLLNHMYAYDNNPPAQPFTADFGWIWGHDQNGTTVDTNGRNGLRTASGNVMTVVLKAGSCCSTNQASIWFDDVSLVEQGGGPTGGNFQNGDFSNGSTGWTNWTVSGAPQAAVTNGEMVLSGGAAFKGGVWQQFSTGGAGRVVNIIGYWRTPTPGSGITAEVMIINAARTPADAADETDGANNAVTLYRNTNTSWDGPMPKTSPGKYQVSFVAAAAQATIILKVTSTAGAARAVAFDNVQARIVPAAGTLNSLPAGFTKRQLTMPSNNVNLVSIAQNPVSKLLYAVRNGNGDTLYRIDVNGASLTQTTITNLSSGSFTGGAQGVTFDPSGNMYISSREGDIIKGTDTNPDPNVDTFSFAMILDLPKLNIGTFHGVGGVAVGPDNKLYINSGSESFYGYLSNGQPEVFLPDYNPGTGQGYWNARILRCSLSGGLNTVEVFSYGIRNSFDITFRSDGKLFGVENGPNTSCDYAEEFNLLEQGSHYGFPYKYGSDLSGSDSSMVCQNSGGGNVAGPPPLPGGISPRGSWGNYGPDGKPGPGQAGYSDGGVYYGFHPHCSPNGVHFYEPALMDPAAIKFPSEFHGRAFVARFGQLETGYANVGRDVVSLRLDEPSEGFLCNTFLGGMGRAIDVLCAYNGRLYIIEFDQTTNGTDLFGSSSRISEIAYTIPANDPNILVSPTSLSPVAMLGQNPTNGTFSVTNNGGGTLTYTITKNAAWLNVNPSSGTSTGESDTITVSYDVTGLTCGVYNATITVSDPLSVNKQQTVTVSLTVRSVKPDFDCDGDVDQQDFGVFQACYSQILGGTPPAGCEAAKLDADGDVDSADLAIFLNCMSGPNNPAAPNCDAP